MLQSVTGKPPLLRLLFDDGNKSTSVISAQLHSYTSHEDLTGLTFRPVPGITRCVGFRMGNSRRRDGLMNRRWVAVQTI
jgi:hypothetical protein